MLKLPTPRGRLSLPFLSFLTSLFGILLVFAIAQVPPFGERSLLSMDAWSQYFPMLMGDKAGLSQWSFQGGLGFNRLAQSAYYTMSPLWLPLLFLPRSATYLVLHLVIALRFALSGFTLSLFLVRRYGESPAVLAFSLAYSLSAYSLAFLNQFMWGDAVLLLPLVALGIERLVAERRPLLYILSLALTLYSCFYIGYMVCLFSVLYFLLVLLRRRRTLREGGVSLAYFSAASLLAGGLAAAVLLPTYLCLQGTIASGLGFGDTLSITHSFSEILLQLLPFPGISLEFGAPNLYCGTLSLLFFLLSPLLAKRSWWERVLFVLLAVLLYFSCTLNLLDFVWHGMHYPNQLPGRWSFIFIFFVVSEGYAAFLAAMASGWTARRGREAVTLFLALLLSLEVLANGALTVATETWTCPVSSYAWWDEPMEKVETTYSEGPWRSEKISAFHFNSGQLYRYHGISYYSSTMSEDAYRFFGKLGMGVYAQNVSTLYRPTNILNMLFGVRYLHAYNGDSPAGLFVDEREVIDTVTVYENRYCLPLVFAASQNALTLSTEELSGEVLQSEMLRALLGEAPGSRYQSEAELARAYRTLAPGGMEILSFSDSRIRGRVTVGEDQLLFTSIAAEPGWRVFVDGERVEPITLFDYLLAVPMAAGEHTVELRYTAPGFGAGLALSLTSATAVILFAVWDERVRRRQKQ